MVDGIFTDQQAQFVKNSDPKSDFIAEATDERVSILSNNESEINKFERRNKEVTAQYESQPNRRNIFGSQRSKFSQSISSVKEIAGIFKSVKLA